MADDYGQLERALSELIGRQLTAVVFIHDYLQFTFDGPCLTAISVPTVQLEDLVLARGQQGYCDALCAQIGVTVCKIGMDGQLLEIGFSNGAILRFSLADSDYTGPEAINYQAEDRGLLVA